MLGLRSPPVLPRVYLERCGVHLLTIDKTLRTGRYSITLLIATGHDIALVRSLFPSDALEAIAPFAGGMAHVGPEHSQ